jgi:hypothetical protein
LKEALSSQHSAVDRSALSKRESEVRSQITDQCRALAGLLK